MNKVTRIGHIGNDFELKQTARELIACSRVQRQESQVLLQRLQALRLHGPLPRGSE